MSLSDGKPQMEDRPSLTDLVYDLRLIKLLLRPFLELFSRLMTSSTTKSTI